ncbi:MAG: hypothetical protein GPJ54_14055 [Candidatus Heimdallarchaeota archaeon]|nr:hypothetical protein [Candidatus Heimdallarchaeota archaeon]
MKYSLKLIFVFELLLLPLLLLNTPGAIASEGDDPVLGIDDNKYHIRIELSQWEIRAYDDVVAQQIADEKYGGDKAKAYDNDEVKEVKHRMGSFERGSTIAIEVYTTDVQHGFSINEVGVAIATIRPEPGEEFGAPRGTEWDWPDEDVTISAFCHIFCGLGHPDMKLKFVIGGGSDELGPPVFYAVIAINVIIFAFVGNKILNKLD